MAYQLYNNGASIAISRNGRTVFIMKSSVAKISIVSGDTINVNTGSCMGSISISYQEVSSPVIFSASDLLNQISYWLHVIEFPPGPVE
jgi:hypothetical protein